MSEEKNIETGKKQQDPGDNKTASGEEKEKSKRGKKTKRSSINVKTFFAIFILVFGTAFITILNSSIRHLTQTGLWYLDKAKRLSLANSSLFVDQDLPDYGDLIMSEEFAKVHQKAVETGNMDLIDDFIYDSDFYRIQDEAWRHLQDLEETYDMTEVILTRCEKSNACWFITSGYDGRLMQGTEFGFTFAEREPDENGVINLVMQVVDRTGDKYYPYHDFFILAASPIITVEDNESYWLVSIGNTTPMVLAFIDYLKSMGLLLLVVTVIISLAGMLVIRSFITSPIIRLKKNAQVFAKENSADHPAKPYHTHIESNDELEDLSDSLYDLEVSVVTTQDELKKFSEERGREKAQLSIAKDIQYGVLPNVFPDEEAYDIYAMMRPAKEVGGDLYDFFRVGDDHLILVIGDVSDKGIPAALFMMTSKTLLKTYAQMNTDPASILKSVNDILVDSNPAGMFVTVWLADLNLKTGLLTAASAGHEYPMFRFGDGQFEVYRDPHGMVLGCVGNRVYQNYEIQLHPGDRILVYSDGAPDAVNPDGVHYGLDNLLSAVQTASAAEDAKGLIEGVITQIDAYSKDAPQFDDITMLALDYRPKRNENS